MAKSTLKKMGVKPGNSVPPYNGQAKGLVERVHQEHLGVEVIATIDVATRKVIGWSAQAKAAA